MEVTDNEVSIAASDWVLRVSRQSVRRSVDRHKISFARAFPETGVISKPAVCFHRESYVLIRSGVSFQHLLSASLLLYTLFIVEIKPGMRLVAMDPL